MLFNFATRQIEPSNVTTRWYDNLVDIYAGLPD